MSLEIDFAVGAGFSATGLKWAIAIGVGTAYLIWGAVNGPALFKARMSGQIGDGQLLTGVGIVLAFLVVLLMYVKV